MPAIDAIVPARFREGDTIEIQGAAFSPTFGENGVLIDGQAAGILSESDTLLTVQVPAGITTDSFVAVTVQRSDTLDNVSSQAWSKALLADLRSGAAPVPGQVPGETEAEDPSPQPVIPQAQDYERMATLAEFILYEVLGATGDLFASDGTPGLTPFGVGAAGLLLGADPGGLEGLVYAAAVRRLTWSWGKRIDAGGGNNGPMVAGGDGDNPSAILGEHGAPLNVTLDQVTVLVDSFAAGDTLDQVQVAVNGAVLYDSGAGLGVTTFHQAALALAVVAGDRIEVRAFKAGVNGIMRLRGKVGA